MGLIFWAPLGAVTFAAVHARTAGRAACWASAAAGMWGLIAVRAAVEGEWFPAVVFGAEAAVWAWFAWRQWRRRKRKRLLLGLMGYKARAVVEAMLRSMPRPGPVLRPVPQGAPS